MKKIIIFLSIIMILVGGFLIYKSTQNKGPSYNFALVEKGNITQEVSETGIIVPAKSIDLDFQTQGRVRAISVKVGDKVRTGQELIRLDQDEFSLQVLEAQAALEVAQAKLAQVLAGASQEDIQVYQTAVTNTEITLANKKQALADVQEDAQNDLAQNYEDMLNILDEAYIKADDALHKQIDALFLDGDTSHPELSFGTTDLRLENNVEQQRLNAGYGLAELHTEIIDLAVNDDEAIDQASIKAKAHLAVIRDFLTDLMKMLNETITLSLLTLDTYKANVTTARTNINTVLVNITNQEQTIVAAEITNQTNINTAQAAVDTAEANLKKAQDELALKKAAPQEADVALAQAQIKQARAALSLNQERLSQTILRSPINGVVTKVDIEIGEITKANQSVISLDSLGQFQIEADIYEEDIVKLKIGNPVDIALIAFPDEILEGKVVAVEPVEKLLEGVVYYKVTIDPLLFALAQKEGVKEGIKQGMTADIVIKTASKENVLIIPEEAIQKKDDRTIVQVLENGVIKKQEIEVGLKGSNKMREVLAGLEQGDKVIINPAPFGGY